jgi:hypothetical protein
MATALQQTTSLTYLCLKYNGFTRRGVASLFDALQVKKSPPPASKLHNACVAGPIG